MPMTELDYISAFRCWLALNWAATLACFFLAAKLICSEVGLSRRPWSILLVTAAPVASYFWYNNNVGQAGVLVLLGCLAWAFCVRRGWPMVGGVFLALACATKLAPFILAPYLLLRRDRRGLAGLALGLALVFFLPAFWVGLDGAADLHYQWAQHTMASHIPMQTFRRGNQSLLAQLARLPAISNGNICYSLDNLNLLHRWYPVLLAVLASGLYAMIWRSHRTLNGPALPETRRQLTNLHLSQLLVFMVVAHPRAWRCNYVALLFPCMTLAAWAWQRRRGTAQCVAALASVVVAICWPTEGLGADGLWSWSAWLQEGKHLWGALAVGGVCWHLDCLTRADVVVSTTRHTKEDSGLPITIQFEQRKGTRRREAA
jgi:hypothetical protein